MDNPTAKVVEVKHKPKSKWRPQPLATIELQKLASRYLHFPSEKTMQVAEKLYQQVLPSYHMALLSFSPPTSAAGCPELSKN